MEYGKLAAARAREKRCSNCLFRFVLRGFEQPGIGRAEQAFKAWWLWQRPLVMLSRSGPLLKVND
jgi:hypothetical protein